MTTPSGKTILITGATDGIGLLTAKKLVEQGHHVLLHGRSASKLKHAAKEVGNAAGSDSADCKYVETYRADLSKLDEVKTLASDIRKKHNNLDVLINNAGVLKTRETTAPSGRDIRFEVNTIAPYILTRDLLPIIPQNGTIINLSSAAQAPVDVAALTNQRQILGNNNDMQAYSQSKLAITIWSSQLARELPNGPVVVAVNPGSLLASKMVKDGFGVPGNDLGIGADILVRAATSSSSSSSSSDEFGMVATGKYYDNDVRSFASPHPAARDKKLVTATMAALSDIAAAAAAGGAVADEV
eukprot:CAMPEP_0113469462 /NCGR_PEP_ID=MMETSP0014_2-20120614/15913_1 /TAXON_ID=2857 /ORGANISM="Nitzschia sp." /LENGTH=298 /DNA_ID=CAMNT_0000361943 /DNA_START=342 /DNA_END=1238 /DNA_ORIENTATION=+ /assembly_acc=CAM_ASM_000159